MENKKIRLAIELALGIVAAGAIGYGAYASSSLQEMREINDLKSQLAESIQKEQDFKDRYLECQSIMDESHKGAEKQREIQIELNKKLMDKMGLEMNR